MTEIFCLNDFPVKIGPLKTLNDDGKMVPVGEDLEISMTLTAADDANPPVPLADVPGLTVILGANAKGERFGAFQALDLDPAVLAAFIDTEVYVVAFGEGSIRGVAPVTLRHPRPVLIEE